MNNIEELELFNEINKKEKRFRNITTIFFFTILILLLGLLYTSFQIREKNKTLEHQNEELDALQKETATAYDSLSTLITALKKFDLIKKEGNEYEQLIDRFAKSEANGNFLIRFHSLNGSPATLSKLEQYFKQEGYNLILFKNIKKRPDWLAAKPSVIYYHKNLKKRANLLAKQLTNLTGREFKAITGAGKGMISGLEKTLININFPD